MKHSPRWATLVAGWLSVLILAAPVMAQLTGRPGAPPAAASSQEAGTRVAVIDVAKIFKLHARFNAQMNGIKQEIEQFEAYIQGEQKKFNQLREALTSFSPGSVEYKQKETELARMQSEMQVSIGLKKKEFLEREARVYYNVYGEIEDSVQLFAQRFRIGLVLRYNGEEMNADDRNSILAGVNRAVVFHDPGIDITTHILAELNKGAVQPTQPQGTQPQIPPTARPPIVPGQSNLR